MLLSILIPTLEKRQCQFARLYTEFQQQIQQQSDPRDIEVLFLRDSGERSIGWKRNELLERSAGTFVAFVDDDDWVSDKYVSVICGALRSHPEVDCLGIKGVITFRGSHPSEFSHSIRYREIFSRGHRYFRPPAHLNPIRREIAIRYRFADISYSEDFDWACRMRDDGALHQEFFIESPLYFYRSRRWWPYQSILDLTESFRHRYGITMLNRLHRLHPEAVPTENANYTPKHD